MKHYTVLLGEEQLLTTTNPIQAMAERAIAWRNYARFYRIRLKSEEVEA